MPRKRIYEDDNARQRACRERKAAREAEAARLAAQERERILQIQVATRIATGKAIQRELLQRGTAGFLGWDQAEMEAVQTIKQIAAALISGSRYLP